MVSTKHDLKYWLAIILPIISIVASFMRVEHRLTKMEASIERLAQISELKQENMERRIIDLERKLAINKNSVK